MPWLTILLTLLSFFGSKRSGASNTRALLTAGLVGGATYAFTHNTDWGSANLGALDGVQPDLATKPVLDAAGNPVLDPATGQPLKGSIPITGSTTKTSGGTGIWDVLKSWGATGTAAVIGTTAVASSSSLQKWMPWFIVGGLVLIARSL